MGGNFSWIGQAWTIGTEIWFYLLAPFVVRRGVVIQIVLASASCVLMVLMGRVSPLTYFFFPANFWFFLLGSLLQIPIFFSPKLVRHSGARFCHSCRVFGWRSQ